MKLTAPSWYPSFHCIADRCRHSCCKGWEIDIDAASYSRYLALPGAFGERIRQSIEITEDSPSFRLDEHERCPFLNADGLCDMILELGEETLCDICTDHPRYRSFLQSSTEIGLGLCCEEACRLVLTWPEKMQIVTLEEDESSQYDEEEESLLALRDAVFTALQNRDKPAAERLADAAAFMGLPLPDCNRSTWAEFFLSLERLDEDWTGILERWRDAGEDGISSFPGRELALEQLACASVHRHLTAAWEEGEAELHLLLALLAPIVLDDLSRALNINCIEDFIDLCRMYSSEIEYSREVLDDLLDWLEEYL